MITARKGRCCDLASAHRASFIPTGSQTLKQTLLADIGGIGQVGSFKGFGMTAQVYHTEIHTSKRNDGEGSITLIVHIVIHPDNV